MQIEYCRAPGSGLMLRATWLAAEVLQRYETKLLSLALCPVDDGSQKGLFNVRVNGRLVWSRSKERRLSDSDDIQRRMSALEAQGFL